MDVVVVAAVAVAEVDVDVLDKLDEEGSEWPLYCIYMYPLALLLPPFAQPHVILCQSLEKVAF